MSCADASPPHADFTWMVERGRVHGRLYTDPAVFDQEMARIFHRTWLCLGHGSEIPGAGDYRVTRMGRQSVIMVRGRDGQVRVLMNRCRHRGATVADDEKGCARQFMCPYHGWVYDSDGALLDVPDAGAYDDSFRKADHGLTPAPRVDFYRGFVFASLARTGPSLDEHLGLAKRYIDIFLDVSPAGEIEVNAGVNKTFFAGNWKLYGMDGYHPSVLHKTVFDVRRRRMPVGISSGAAAGSFGDDTGNLTRDLGNGHVLLDVSPGRRANYAANLDAMLSRPGWGPYYESLVKAHGQERADEVLTWAGDPHLGVFPNLQLIGAQMTIIRPVAVDRTEIMVFPARLKQVPPEVNALRLRSHEVFYGPAGHGAPDDSEASERVQEGLSADVEPWILLSRGLHRERVEADGSIVGAITDEVTQRGQLKQWKHLMGQA